MGTGDARGKAENTHLNLALRLRMHADLSISPSPIHLHWMVLRQRGILIFNLIR
jgi:hypothetical protein